MYGGGQERGLRSGTMPVHQIVGFGRACELAMAEMAAQSTPLAAVRAGLGEGIANLPGVKLNTPLQASLPGLLNVSFNGIEGESLLTGLPELALASGSACNSDSDEPSYVLRALGHDRESAQSSLRFSLGRDTSVAQIEVAIAAVRRQVLRLRALAGAAVAVDEPSASGEAGTREQGTWVRFMLHVRDGQIEQARFQAYGCPQTLAACEWLSGQLRGRSWRKPGLGGPLARARGVALPPDRLGRLLVGRDRRSGGRERGQPAARPHGSIG